MDNSYYADSDSTLLVDRVHSRFHDEDADGSESSATTLVVSRVVHSVVNWKLVSTIMNLLLLVTGGALYKHIATTLTDWENHRTDTEWKNALIAKEFAYAFINNYFVREARYKALPQCPANRTESWMLQVLIYIAYVEPCVRRPCKSVPAQKEIKGR